MKLLIFILSVLFIGTICFLCLFLCFLNYFIHDIIGDEENEDGD